MAIDLVGQNISIREALRQGKPLNVNSGTFAPSNGSGGAAYYDRWIDRVALATGATNITLFNTPVNTGVTGARTPADTNTTATQVPQGELWNLYGIQFFVHSPTGAALDAATKTALNLFIQNASYKISFNQQIVREMPLWCHFGSQLSQETAVSTTLAMQSPLPKRDEWMESWPPELFLPLQSGIVMTMTVAFPALAAALNGFLFGVAFDRDRLTQTP
jgi:hypothetical protein